MFWALTSQVDVDARTLNSMRGRGVSHYVPSAKKNTYVYQGVSTCNAYSSILCWAGLVCDHHSAHVQQLYRPRAMSSDVCRACDLIESFACLLARYLQILPCSPVCGSGKTVYNSTQRVLPWLLYSGM